MTSPHATLRSRAEGEARHLPPLLASADHLARTVLLGEHGRRRAGLGDDFWQYRPAQSGDSRRLIDHRRSARGDQQYVREREWQIAQSVVIWLDQGASMRFAATSKHVQKIDRARLLTLAIAILLIRAGERVGLTGTRLPPRRGRAQINQLAQALSIDEDAEYAPPQHRALIPQARALFVSDFLGEISEVETTLAKAADRGLRGILFQVLDPSEERFPFHGRTIFHSAAGTFEHQTLAAADLRDAYLQRLHERRAHLSALCRAAGWQFGIHRTDASAQSALLWLYRALAPGDGR